MNLLQRKGGEKFTLEEVKSLSKSKRKKTNRSALSNESNDKCPELTNAILHAGDILNCKYFFIQQLTHFYTETWFLLASLEQSLERVKALMSTIDPLFHDRIQHYISSLNALVSAVLNTFIIIYS